MEISSNPLCKIYLIDSMSRKKIAIASGVMLSLLILPSASSLAFAEYIPLDGQTGLDDIMKIQEDRIKAVQDNPGAGSGTPIFAADGVFGAAVLSTVVFGGVAAAFFVRGTKGKYATMGRG